MHTLGSDVGTSLAGDPEDTHISLLIVVKHFAFVDGTDTQLLLDGRDEWGSLEDGSYQTHEGLFYLLYLFNVLMELEDGNVLFTS